MPGKEAQATPKVDGDAGPAVHYAAHQRGILHRDLKPANILLPREKEGGKPEADLPLSAFPLVKVTDFGLAKQLDTEARPDPDRGRRGHAQLHAARASMGQSKEIGPAADIYALGALLYELLTGRPPFKGETAMDTLIQVLADDPVAPSRLQPKVPRDLETICLKCLAKEPRQRYSTAETLADDLGRFLGGEPIAARPASGWERGLKWIRRRPAVAGLIALVVLVAALGFTGVTWKWREAVDQAHKTEKALAQAETNLYFNRIALAHREWGVRHVTLRESWSMPVPNRSASGNGAIYSISAMPRSKLGRAHDEQMTHVVYSRDGRQLATASMDRTVKIWDAATGTVRFTLRGHAGNVWNVAFSPNGKLLASASADHTVKVWNAATGAELLTFRGHDKAVCGLAFSPDGGRIASAAGKVLLWDSTTGKVEKTLSGAEPESHSIAFSPDGLRLGSRQLSPTAGNLGLKDRDGRRHPSHAGPAGDLRSSLQPGQRPRGHHRCRYDRARLGFKHAAWLSRSPGVRTSCLVWPSVPMASASRRPAATKP